MFLSPIMPPVAVWLLIAAAACIIVIAVIYLLRVRNVVKYRHRADHERADLPDASFPPASVVIYSQGDADNLATMLDAILGQDYPAAFEVIVVNEGESADVRDTVSLLRASHPNIYLTFTPEGVVNLSRKKLALTLGIKAARYDIVVLTTTAAIIPSPLWLRRMMTAFGRDAATDVVLGFAAIDPDEDNAYGRRRRAFDYVADSTRWLAVAVAGKPFRGTEYNIAYRKDAFMRNKGFARTLNLHYGDDDIFISEITRPGNTAVELSEDSIVAIRHGNHPRLARERVLRRHFTESFIKRRPRILVPLAGWLHIAAFATALAAAIVAYPNMQGAIIAALLIIALAALDIVVWRPAMAALKSRHLTLCLPWLAATYPLRRILTRIRSRLGKHKKYTWD